MDTEGDGLKYWMERMIRLHGRDPAIRKREQERWRAMDAELTMVILETCPRDLRSKVSAMKNAAEQYTWLINKYQPPLYRAKL